MNSELQDKLYADFPEVLQEHKLSIYESCMSWGFECGDGWEPVIRQMCKLLSRKVCTTVKKKQLFPYQHELKVWFHNKCRKIEKLLKIPYNTLYQAKFDNYTNFPGYSVRLTQVKEKFGSLRVYYDIHPNFEKSEVVHIPEKELVKAQERYAGYVDGVVSFAEEASSTICDTHGKPGQLKTKGWWHVACEECEKNEKKNENASTS
jgi:hypothetical protein